MLTRFSVLIYQYAPPLLGTDLSVWPYSIYLLNYVTLQPGQVPPTLPPTLLPTRLAGTDARMVVPGAVPRA
eukprot:1980285-Rhodomonas_salina.1